jgi:hypothetical protein
MAVLILADEQLGRVVEGIRAAAGVGAAEPAVFGLS